MMIKKRGPGVGALLNSVIKVVIANVYYLARPLVRCLLLIKSLPILIGNNGGCRLCNYLKKSTYFAVPVAAGAGAGAAC
jgi:hypothetical protein